LGFKGYKLKHKLIVLHNLQDSSDPSSVYARTFEITFFISTVKSGTIRFDEMETVISRTLSRYSEKELEQIPPFDKLEPTLENMGDEFYQLIKQNLTSIGTFLEMLEISESPIETYIVNETTAKERLFVRDKKIKISSLIMENVISQSVVHMVSEFEKPEQQMISAEPAPQPEREEEEPELPVKDAQKPVKKHEPMPIFNPVNPRLATYKFACGVLFLIVFGSLMALYLKNAEAYPMGADIYGHLFKSDLLYNKIKQGDFYPLYTDLWYNGIQPYRYWAPLPYYIMAILQFFAGGSALSAYLIFVVFAFVVGGTGWLLWGMTYNRVLLCTALGCMWFFLPDNVSVFFIAGNLPRMVVSMFLPYLFYFIWRFVEHRIKWAIVPVIILMCFITLCHAMIAAMTGVTVFIFLLIYSISQRRIKESLQIIIGMLLSFALSGIWLFPALKGGLIGMNGSANSEMLKLLSTPVLVSLNPMLRSEGQYELFYFGLSILVLSVIGLFLADKKSRVGFYTVIIVFCGTTTALVPFLERLPMSQVFWMTRFTPIVYAVFILSLLEWKNCRRYAMILLLAVIVLDSIPSADLLRYHSLLPSAFKYTVADAKKITNQRISLLDLSAYGPYPSYGIPTEEPRTQYTFGWAWQGASTADNIMMVNTALEKGFYYYMFDRSLELGDDTVLVRKEMVQKAKMTLSVLTEAAAASGYSLYKETNFTYIFHNSTPKTFGVKTAYSGLAIGRNARTIALEYPSFEEGSKGNLNDYTLKELCRYKVLYLSGFTYSDRESAEDLLDMAADKGVKVIIDMNRIPIDPVTSRMTFFDITAQSITFTNQYPELMYKNKIYDAKPFKEEYSTWNTVYLENVNHVLGYSWFQNKKLSFMGTGNNENIIFIGYNFLYHAMEANDQSILSLMTNMIQIEPNQLPERKIVPLNISTQEDRIIIDSPGGVVNTTIAYQDNFRSSQKLINQNNLLTIVEPHTEIRIVYPYLFEGMATSFAGLAGIILFLYLLYREKRYAQ
jgi:6-pyruvoyl tetrahydropterin synthase-like protein